jgi:hypothetical protein
VDEVHTIGTTPYVGTVTPIDGFALTIDVPHVVEEDVDRLVVAVGYITGGGGSLTVHDLTDDVALTYLGPGASSGAQQEFPQLFHLPAPTPGPHTLRLTCDGAQCFWTGAVMSWSGGDAEDPFGVVAGGSPAGFFPFPSTLASLSVVASPGDVVLDNVFNNGVLGPPSGQTAGTGQSELWRVNNSTTPAFLGAGSMKPAAASPETVTWTTVDDSELRYAAVALHADLTITVEPPLVGTWTRDLGVAYAEGGAALTRVAATPGEGQYTVSAGTYTFNSLDAAEDVAISYAYTTAEGRSVTITNGFQGLAPEFSCVLESSYGGRQVALVLNRCVSARLTLPAPAEQFAVADLEFEALADLDGEIGRWSNL